MRMHLKLVSLAIAVAVLLTASPVLAGFSLAITEIWPGNDPGSNLTEDWFEITNTGDAAWTAAIDGNLWFDDDSADPTTADLMSGIASIAPGQSVIFVDGGPAAATAWTNLWDDVVIPWAVGSYDGAGLGQGGDAIFIWIKATMPTGGDLPAFSGSFPDATSNGGQSYDLTLGAFSVVGNANNAVATIVLNDANQPAIGSPGSPIPEPSSFVLAGIGMIATAGYVIRRRRTAG